MKINRMITYRLIGFVSIISVCIQACTKDYAEINTDKNAIATVGDAEIPFLFSGAIAICSSWTLALALNFTGISVTAGEFK